MLDPGDTIAAIATPLVGAERGIVRLTGPAAWSVALVGFQPDRSDASLAPRWATWIPGRLRVSGLRARLPAALALWPAPRTYTGQALAEIHTIGSVPIIQAVLADCLIQGARLAEPGEFTLRAFLAGRIDLTQAEAVLGVIEARHPAQLQAALRQLAGGLSDPIRALRERLLDLVAHLEAMLDFVEEPDVDALGRPALAAELARAAGWLAELARQFAERDRPERRPRVVLAGAPNVGKSRLFKALVEDGRALVADQAGTTRDYLAAPCRCAELMIELIDTAGAGAEAPDNTMLAAAQERRSDQMAAADLILLCRSPDRDLPERLVADVAGPALRVWTQADRARTDLPDWIVTSAVTGAGLDVLRQAIASRLHTLLAADGETASMTGARCRESLTEASQALESAARAVEQGVPEDLISLDVRAAIDALGAVLGLVVSDDILDRIFARFCIGK